MPAGSQTALEIDMCGTVTNMAKGGRNVYNEKAARFYSGKRSYQIT